MMLHMVVIWTGAILVAIGIQPGDPGPPPSTVTEIADALRTGKLTQGDTGEGVVMWPEPFLVDAATTPDGACDQLLAFRDLSDGCLVLVYRRERDLYAACVYADRPWGEPQEEWPIFDQHLFDEHVGLRIDRQQPAEEIADGKDSGTGDGPQPPVVDSGSGLEELGLKQRLKRDLIETLAEKLQGKFMPNATPFDDIVRALREGWMKQGPKRDNEAVVEWSDHPLLYERTTDSRGTSHGSRVETTFRRYLFFYSSRADGQESTDDSAFLLDQDLEPHEEWFYYDSERMAEHVHAVQERIRNLPAVPSGVTASNNHDCSATITWVDNSDNETRFDILREEYRFLSWPSPVEWHLFVDEGVTSFTDRGITGKYRYRVRALNESGASAPSDPVVVAVTSESVSTVQEIASALVSGRIAQGATGDGVVVWPIPWLVDEVIAPDGASDQLAAFRSKDHLVLVFRRDLAIYAACVLYTEHAYSPGVERWPLFDAALFSQHVRMRTPGWLGALLERMFAENQRQEDSSLGKLLMWTNDGSSLDALVAAFEDGRLEQGGTGHEIVSWPKTSWFWNSVKDEGAGSNPSVSVERQGDRYLFVYRDGGGSDAQLRSAFLLDAGQEPHERWYMFDAALMAEHVRLRSTPGHSPTEADTGGY